MINLRKFLSADLVKVMEIERNSFSEPWPESYLKKFCKNHPHEFLVAENKGEVVGFVAGEISENLGKVSLIAVDQNYREKGVGKKLLEFILNHFKEKGIRTVVARARTENEKGVAFLKSFGFEITEMIKKYYPNGDDAYLMEKDLGG
jgi:ribosomal-protein-alanine N-acetyltransferase